MEYDESRVYTALNADELKAGDKVYVANTLYDLECDVRNEQNLAVIQKIYARDCSSRFNVYFDDYVTSDEYCLAYLVERAKEKKYRPYESIDEFVSDFIKRFNTHCSNYAMPLIWLRNKDNNNVQCIMGFVEQFFVCLPYSPDSAAGMQKLQTLFDDYEFLDGSPCGKEIEE